MPAAKAAETPAKIVIPRPDIQRLRVPIQGLTPLIVHAWSEKAKRQILDKQRKIPSTGREIRDPERDYNDSRYIASRGWDGFPAVGFKASMVGACRQIPGSGLPMTLAKLLFFVEGDGQDEKNMDGLVKIEGTPQMREDMVRLETGVADIRFRAMYMPWTATLQVRFNAGMVSAEQVVNLLMLAGSSVGIGEWRPSAPKSATGTFGLWEVEESKL